MDIHERHIIEHNVRDIAEPVLAHLGCDVVAVELTGDRHGAILRLSIDRPGGVQITDCTSATHALSPELDVEDPVPGAYRLEVSSPGMERPVQRLQDFQRFQGYRIRVRRIHPDGRKQRIRGVIDAIEAETILLDVDGKPVHIPLVEIDRAHLDLDPEQYAKLGEAIPTAEGESR